MVVISCTISVLPLSLSLSLSPERVFSIFLLRNIASHSNTKVKCARLHKLRPFLFSLSFSSLDACCAASLLPIFLDNLHRLKSDRNSIHAYGNARPPRPFLLHLITAIAISRLFLISFGAYPKAGPSCFITISHICSALFCSCKSFAARRKQLPTPDWVADLITSPSCGESRCLSG